MRSARPVERARKGIVRLDGGRRGHVGWGIDQCGKPRGNCAESSGTACSAVRRNPFFVGENAMLRRSNAIAYCTCE
ncbi:hypothetical protein RSPO_c01784 [Ralstonia solanacearum Po82]|uniref:Uncharacterized protein n=1 Tax=Ralstonia solanacearum (strain Po82) TaxID=1031711 RepID=F6G1L4_RALS8|nr:hypothetical protein RSPO_c01784 [Ralstonia solanacearum Po82]